MRSTVRRTFNLTAHFYEPPGGTLRQRYLYSQARDSLLNRCFVSYRCKKQESNSRVWNRLRRKFP